MVTKETLEVSVDTTAEAVCVASAHWERGWTTRILTPLTLTTPTNPLTLTQF